MTSVLGTRPEQIQEEQMAEFYLGMLGTGVRMALWPTGTHLGVTGEILRMNLTPREAKQTEKRNQDTQRHC